jgi:hypothetical protein
MKAGKSLLAILIIVASGCKAPEKTKCSDSESASIKIDKRAVGQLYVVGHVRDSKSQEAIVYATLIFLDSNGKQFGVQTDAEGKFIMKDIPAGSYALTVSATEYDVLNRPIQLTGGNEHNLEINLVKKILMVEKPVIYLYPVTQQQVRVRLDFDGELTHTYPQYPEAGWTVTAAPEGTLIDDKGMEYYSLFWEGIPEKQWTASDGFVVAGKGTAAFLEEKLAYLGLNRREANEFILHWLPRMENNAFNLIHFSGKAYEETAKLNITPGPETVIRVMMLTQPLKSKIEFPLQDLSGFGKERKGFTVVEWGGAEVECVREGI